MRRALLLLGFAAILATVPVSSPAAGRTSLAVAVGGGLPVGWWSERWGLFQSGEINLRYEFSRGAGLLLFTGLSKTYFADLSPQDIIAESRYNDFLFPDSLRTIIAAEQGGSFKQLPIGFGFYREGLLAGYRTYGSLAMVVHLWRFDRRQLFEYDRASPLGDSTIIVRDNWSDQQVGSNVGFQLAGGMLYPLRPGLFLDVSMAYHLAAISRNNSAIAYWGKPARTWPGARKESAKPRADFLLLRVGVRFGG